MIGVKRLLWTSCLALWAITMLTACGGTARNTAEGDNTLELGPPMATPLMQAYASTIDSQDSALQETLQDSHIEIVPSAQETARPESAERTTEGILPTETPTAYYIEMTESADLKSNYKASEVAFIIRNDTEFSFYQRDAAAKALHDMGIQTEGQDLILTMTHQSGAFMSCLIDIVPKDGSGSSSFTSLTLDSRNGERIRLMDLFIDNSGWQGILSDIVMRIAQEADMTLLCDVPPVRDDHTFFLWQGNIALVYKPFEITTYEEESPCFMISIDEIEEYLLEARLIGG